jgi:hypothetical protein
MPGFSAVSFSVCLREYSRQSFERDGSMKMILTAATILSLAAGASMGAEQRTDLPETFLTYYGVKEKVDFDLKYEDAVRECHASLYVSYYIC